MNTDNNEKRAKFDALPSPEVSSFEVRNIPTTGGGYVGRLVDWLKSKGVIGQYKNTETGWGNIVVNKSSVKSVTHHGAGAGKIALLEAAPDLIKNGIFLETNPKNDDGLISHIFAGKATVDGILYAVCYVVREDYNGRRYYDHSLIKIEALDCIDSQAPTFTSENAPRTRLQITRPGAKSTGENPDGQAPTQLTGRAGEGTQPKEEKPPVTWLDAKPAGEESTVNILKKHLCVNTKNKN